MIESVNVFAADSLKVYLIIYVFSVALSAVLR